MKLIKRLVAFLLVIVLFIGAFITSFKLFNKGTYGFDTKDLAVFDENMDCYYLQKVPKNIKFRISNLDTSKAIEYSLVDSNENAINSKAEQIFHGDYNILPPSDGYIEGERYTLSLPPHLSFTDENLKNAKTLVFCIERTPIEEYKFSETVVETSEPIEELSENTIKVDNLTGQLGQVIFGKNTNEEYVVYKIEEVANDGTATVTTPALDEIYSALEVYGEYEFDVDDLIANPDLEIEIIENVKKSSFYTSLITTAYASEVPKDGSLDVSITPDKDDNSLEIQIKITLEPGKRGLFGIDELRNHSVTLTLKTKIGLSMKCNIQGIINWDISTSAKSNFTWSIEITHMLKDEKWDSDLEALFSEKEEYSSYDEYYIQKQYQNNVKKIINKLNQITEDATGGEIKIFDWKLLVPSVPGLYFSAEVKIFANFEMTATVVVGQENLTVYTVGVCFTNHKFKTYSNTYRSGKDVSLSLRGRTKAKAGIKLIVNGTLINAKVANINIDPQVGLYTEVYVTIPILGKDEATPDRLAYGYFEPGAYFSASVNATLNVLVKTFEFSYELVEKKFPIKAWTLGNKKIATGIISNVATVRAVNNVVNVPDILFEYYDVKSGSYGTEKISYEDLKFVTNEGEKLTVKGEKLILPKATSSGSAYVTATYLHSDGRVYSTVFRVLISGSMLEGKVSAYTEDSSTGALEGALVDLYSSVNNTAPISSQKTDANGNFSFNLSKGDYRLVIGAEGYRTLISNQRVDTDEIKYTEHILLMDNSQTGIGTAGGTITNALDGRGISGVQLKLRNDWNNTKGAYMNDFLANTDSSGKYSISDVPVGYYTIEASLDGYVTGYSNIIVLNQNARTDFDFTITPVLDTDEIRIVLTWGASPYDLDSHLIGRTPNDESFNVYYGDKVYQFDDVEMANLDVDDTTSYGPETITITENIYGAYTYAVHDYSNKGSTESNQLSFSGAVVRVFIGSNQVAEYHVPTDQIGTYWTVFQIDNSGRPMPINTVSNTKPAS